MKKTIHSLLMLAALIAVLMPSAPVIAQAGGEQTYTMQPDSASLNDILLHSYYYNSNYTSWDVIGVGERNDQTGWIFRSLLQFDLSGLPREVDVISATVTLTVKTDLATSASTMSAYAVQKSWCPTTVAWNWRCQGQGSSVWQTGGAAGATDIVSVPIASAALANNLAANSTVTLNLDPYAVEQLVRGNYFGFMIRTNVESNDAYEFYSSNSLEATKRPKIDITYIVNDNVIFEDVGWTCQTYLSQTCDNPSPQTPYLDSGNYQVSHIIGQSKGLTAARELCEPAVSCINDYPIYFKVEYDVNWAASGSVSVIYGINVVIPGGTSPGNFSVSCGTGTSGHCRGIFEGVIPINNLPAYSEAAYTVALEEWSNVGVTWPTDVNASWNVYISLIPFDEECAAIYTVPVPETFEINPQIETPLGINGAPADQQIFPTEIGQVYMARVEGAWHDGTLDRADAAVSVDGVTWKSWGEFALDAACLTPNIYANAGVYTSTIYFTATTETFYIRANDAPGAFANNVTNAVKHFQYVIGWAYLIPMPPTCDAQYTYDATAPLASVVVAGTSTDTPASNVTIEPGAWYAVDVVNNTTWNESGGLPRVDMEFYFAANGTLGETGWADLGAGGLVACVSADGRKAFVQAPPQSGLVLHLRVNDQDLPQNWADNQNALNVSIHAAAFTRALSDCEGQYTLGSLVSSGTVAANATNGKAFANSLISPSLISESYKLTSGGWYALDTTLGPWWQTFSGGGYAANTYYYDMQIREDSGAWSALADWTLAACATQLDGLGHVRVYFQVPNAELDGVGKTFYLRAAGASVFGRGEMGWNLYQTVDLTSDNTGNCADWVYDPNVTAGIGAIDSRQASGNVLPVSAALPSEYLAIQIESADNGSGWYETAGGAESDSLQLSSNGTTWHALPNHPDVLCFYNTPVQNELVFLVRRQSLTSPDLIWRMRADSSTFSNNVGSENYRVYPASIGALDPWSDCAGDYTASVPALNEHEWIPPQDSEGVTIMPTLTYTPGMDPNGTGIINWGDPGLAPGHTYQVATIKGPWKDPVNSSYDAELSSDNGATWYSFRNHPQIICSAEDQIGWYWKAIFSVSEGQQWKIRVADAGVFTDNSGNLAYKLNLINEFPVEGPGALASDYDPSAFDVCAQTIVRPAALGLSEIGSVGNYLGDWLHFVTRSTMSFMAWCPKHTDLLLSALEALKTREPLATVAELATIQKTVVTEVNSYNWEGGGYNDTSIFSAQSSADVEAIANRFLPESGSALAPWQEGGNLVNFNAGNNALPEYYYTCNSVFADYLPSRLKYGVCFVSAYWKQTGASFWVQISLDIGAIFLLWMMIKGAAQSLIYMMTGVRPWTKDGAQKMIIDVANGSDLIQPVGQWRSRSGSRSR